MKRLFLPFVLTVSLLIQLPMAFGQGSAFTYQGHLTDDGSPANGLYDFRFKLYSDSLGNTQVGVSYLANGIPTTNGLFTVAIDYGAAIFTGSNYWLEVDVKTNGAGSYALLSPLQAVTPTPYAIMANSASNLLGTFPAAQLNGTILNAALPGSPSFSGTVTAMSFSGGGADLTNVNADTLNGLSATNFWQPGGNTVSPGQFLGSLNNQPVELRVNNLRALQLMPDYWGYGAPNVIGGSPYNFVSPYVTGATIGGGGATNYADYEAYTNKVTSDFGTVSGGYQNASSYAATVAGGYYNTASGGRSVVGGGDGNTASGENATVAGGFVNLATNYASTVPGGAQNLAGGWYSFAAGQRAKATNRGAFVWADSQNSDFSSTNIDSFNVRAAGGVRLVTGSAGMTLDGQPVLTTGSSTLGLSLQQNFSGGPNVIEGSPDNFVADGVVGATIGGGGAANFFGFASYTNRVTQHFGTVSGGYDNIAGGQGATVGGGYRNAATNTYATISGGYGNTAAGYTSTVGGGDANTAGNSSATVGGGYANNATGAEATVGGGYANSASGYYATVGGGDTNTASGYYATVPGGTFNIAGGDNSFAAGRDARALHDGAFVWNDGVSGSLTSTNANSVSMRASGGYRLLSGYASGVFLAPGGGSWTSLSDRNAKEHFAKVNTQTVLARVAALPLSTWNYKSQDAHIRHLGPMAQDFKAAFGIGETDKGITAIDAEGVALAAIQGLNQKVDRREASLETQLQQKDAEIQQLEQTVSHLNQIVRQLARKQTAVK